MTAAFNPWSYRAGAGVGTGGVDLVGYEVEATDGRIGKVDGASYEVGASHVVVDSGPWIFGNKLLLPAGTIDRMDVNDRKVYVDRTKNQIKDVPQLDNATWMDPGYREQIGKHYCDTYGYAGPPGA